jgi:hypothetical protein
MAHGKLGKRPRRHDPRTIHLADYVPAGAPPIPPGQEDWENKLAFWGMMKNDKVGDCTVAAAGHFEMLWTAYSGTEIIPTDEQIIAAYAAITGYDPVTGMNDNGAVELDVLNYWRKTGIASRMIEGYASIDPPNTAQVCQAIYLFGGVYIGFEVPQSAMDQFDAGQAWDVVANDGGIQGGHAVPVMGYNAQGGACITWGKIQRFTWAFWKKYVDESYAVLSTDWFNSKGMTPAGFGVDELRRDLGLIAGGPPPLTASAQIIVQ